MLAVIIIIITGCGFDYYLQLRGAFASLSLDLCNTSIEVREAETPSFIHKETETRRGQVTSSESSADTFWNQRLLG